MRAIITIGIAALLSIIAAEALADSDWRDAALSFIMLLLVFITIDGKP